MTTSTVLVELATDVSACRSSVGRFLVQIQTEMLWTVCLLAWESAPLTPTIAVLETGTRRRCNAGFRAGSPRVPEAVCCRILAWDFAKVLAFSGNRRPCPGLSRQL